MKPSGGGEAIGMAADGGSRCGVVAAKEGVAESSVWGRDAATGENDQFYKRGEVGVAVPASEIVPLVGPHQPVKFSIGELRVHPLGGTP